MAEKDRQRLLAQAMALRTASPDDFVIGPPPSDADPSHLKLINDTALRTKLVDARVAEGLQSPKGPQKIASIVRVYPGFDAPGRQPRTTGRPPGRPPGRPAANGRAALPPPRGLPTVEQMERLLARIREVEAEVTSTLASDAGAEIDRLKRSLGNLSGEALEQAYAELGSALERRRALASQARAEAFARIERDGDFDLRSFLRLLARG